MEMPKPDELVLDAFRRWGYLAANLDPLGRLQPETPSDLQIEGEAADRARRIYCGSIGVEFMHIPNPEVRRWVQERMESDPTTVDPKRVLERLIGGELFEQFLQSRYLGNKRFSIEGLTALLPLLDAILVDASERGTDRLILAMSHRGRLTVMANIVGTPTRDLFAGFEDVDPKSVLGGGDVKYHMGATGLYDTGDGRQVKIHLASNPSHLDAVDPVIMGRVRAKQQRRRADPRSQVLPVMVHGDSAFAGQGILAETLNLADLEGYAVGGTIHIIANNWIGFTTEPKAYSSTRFATDVAKRLPSPIFHVNGEDPDAVVRAGRMASEYRAEFSTDVVIDLIGYRRHGHSEIDDPTLTQPRLYSVIREIKPLRTSYAERSGVDPTWVREQTEKVQMGLEVAQQEGVGLEKKPNLASLPPYWEPYSGGFYDLAMEIDTGVPAIELARLGEIVTHLPEGFTAHPKAKRLLSQRLEMAHGERPIDFGAAEALAFASLLDEGTPIRLTGQDSRRGTFNHRHSVLLDIETEAEHTPLKGTVQAGAFFEVYDSPLSEASVLGFEYGFSRDYPEALVLWEAQFGDFANGAQVPIDQFIAAGEDKWGLLSGLVLLLPHGYEGQGPEHSSARLERYLQLAAEDNIQICQPSSAAQYFHLLRRQALRKWRKPLIVMTPKSMLRHKAATSPIQKLSAPRFEVVVDDLEFPQASRILFCTGKIVHELRAERTRRDDTDTAIISLDQLYPFPRQTISRVMDRHAEARELLWVQNEPANQGALSYVIPRLEQVSGGRHIRTVKRRESASPSTGSAKAHAFEQKALLQLAFEA